jgi:hypothetical protein
MTLNPIKYLNAIKISKYFCRRLLDVRSLP